MQIVPYLSFNGQCEEAFRFYGKCLGGKVEIRTFSDSPMAKELSPEWHGRVMHAQLVTGDALLMGSDGPPDQPEEMKGVHVALMIRNAVEAERVFNTLAEGGAVRMPLAETFWALRFGILVDKFGTAWMINSLRPS